LAAASKKTLAKKALEQGAPPTKEAKIKSVKPSATPDWPILNTTLVAIENVRPRERNPNKHPEEQVEQLAQSLLERGWTMPVLVDEGGELIAGHGRLMAAHVLVTRGHEQFRRVPVATAKGWSPAQIRAYVIADNLLAQGSKMDRQMLKEEVQALKADGFDMSLLAMSEKALSINLDHPVLRNEANFEFGGDRFIVLIECESEKQQQELFMELNERGLACKIS
jgi:hypothetical protein